MNYLALLGISLLVEPVLAQSVQLTMQRAVSVQWPSREDRDYCIWRSHDFKNWDVAEPRIPGSKGSVEWFIAADTATASFFKVEELPGPITNRFIGLTNILFQTASPVFNAGHLYLSNVRMISQETGMGDSVDVSFAFDPTSQSFKMTSKTINNGVGVFNDPHFAKDVPAAVTMSGSNGAVYQMNNSYSIK
jgi:hypothetical protein